MPNTTRGITYPASTAHTRLWEHLQTLAETVDDALEDVGPTAWTAFTPQLYDATTGVAAAQSSPWGRYALIGPSTVLAQAEVTSTNAITGGCAVSLPFACAKRTILGTLALFGPGATPADQCGHAWPTSGLDRFVVVSYGLGFRNSAATNVLRYSVQYETP